MTLCKPTIKINKLAVYRDASIVFQTVFHSGVNIVRGHNSSGKTTVLDFLAYSLGAEYIPWKPPALLSTHTLVELLLNDKVVTLRRAVSPRPMNSIQIYWGRFDAALNAGMHDWEEYPFRRSTSKISFTQSLLLALEMPESMGEGASNLTMHQFLRVLYADQPSLHSPIFRVDSFDNALTREVVGGYLCGIYDDALYASRLERREIEKLLEKLDVELKGIFSVLGRSGQGANVEWLAQRINNVSAEKELLDKELSRLKSERTVSAESAKKPKDTEDLRLALNKAKDAYNTSLDKRAVIELEIADSRHFIAELDARLANLAESSNTRNYFGTLAFNYCPACLSELKADASDDARCSLCKSAITGQSGDSQLLRMRNELNIQRRESISLISIREEELKKVRLELPTLKLQLLTLEKQYSQLASYWSTDLELAVENAAKRIGELEQEAKNLFELQKLASAISELQQERQRLTERQAQIDTQIESIVYSQEVRKVEVGAEIASTLTRLLRKDLPRQDEFIAAENVQFSFVDNQISVNGSTQFSESSTVVLRHLFHLALLSASTRKKFMRLPRFMILDGIEDGGMELERSHQLQRIIVEECANFDCDFQLIFATSQINPELEIDSLVVGRSFSEEHKSLGIL